MVNLSKYYGKHWKYRSQLPGPGVTLVHSTQEGAAHVHIREGLFQLKVELLLLQRGSGPTPYGTPTTWPMSVIRASE